LRLIEPPFVCGCFRKKAETMAENKILHTPMSQNNCKVKGLALNALNLSE
jgi:hypothetical protein